MPTYPLSTSWSAPIALLAVPEPAPASAGSRLPVIVNLAVGALLAAAILLL